MVMFRKMTIALVAASGLLVAPVVAQQNTHDLSGGGSKAPPTSAQDSDKSDKSDKTGKTESTEKLGEKTEKLDKTEKSAEGSEEKSDKTAGSHGHKAARHHRHHGAKHEASRHGNSALLKHHSRNRPARAYGRARHIRQGM
jgi:hypothetical protein